MNDLPGWQANAAAMRVAMGEGRVLTFCYVKFGGRDEKCFVDFYTLSFALCGEFTEGGGLWGTFGEWSY